LDHFLARWGIRRGEHRVRPGLYSVGIPSRNSPVLVTSNYTLSFDAVRSSLKGIDAYILVLNTFGINVWCAAGKGTFGTEELVERIETSGLAHYIDHRTIIVPQLGASGVAAHKVKQQSGFKVEYGPVRAVDIPQYLEGNITPAMRLVRFNIADRMVLVPVELKGVVLPALAVALLAYFTGGIFMSLAVICGVFTGTVLFPLLLPYLPTRDFSTKGFFLGGLFGAGAILIGGIWWDAAAALWIKITSTLSHMLIWPALVGFLGLNFTGSTPWASRTGVRREIYRYVRIMAVAFVLGVILNLVSSLAG
jgi:hypothetical protein